MTLICDGDSWVFGCEIVIPSISTRYDKNIHPGVYDHTEENDSYRIPRIFPTYLGKLLDADVINLSWPADDNGTILSRTISFLTSEYINKGVPTDDLFVIIGWSTPERNSFWYKDDKISRRYRLWPQDSNCDTPQQKEIWKNYVQYLWNPEEYLPRYLMNILQFQNFCNVNKIKWMCFSSFYQAPAKCPNEWFDLDIKSELQKINRDAISYHKSTELKRISYPYEYVPLWESIDDIRFYKKNLSNNTFRSFMVSKNVEPVYNGWHPSPSSHKLWAEELYEYINNNKLI